MTADLNQHILNLKPSIVPQPQHEPYKLTFFVENETDNNARHLQLTDFTESQSHRQTFSNYYDDVIVESYDSPVDKTKISRYGRVGHESYCVLSALLYFVTVTAFVYLAILWIKQRMYIRMEQMHWW